MAKPTVKVEIAFSDLPYVSSPAWTDVTSYVRSVSTRRGRNSDWDDMGSGTASIVLDNRDRRFDPTYTSGPYYGLLQPRRQIRVTADAGTGAGYVALFRGFVAGWPVEVTDAGFDSTVTLQCFDILGLLSQAETPREWADYYIRSLNPSRYWRFDENINPADIPTTTATLTNLQLKDYGADNVPFSPVSINTPISSTESLAPGLTSTGLQWPLGFVFDTNPYDQNYNPSAAEGGGSIWFLGQSSQTIWHQEWLTGGTQYVIDIFYTTASSLMTLLIAGPGSVYTYTATVNPVIGVGHHVGFRWVGTGAGGTAALYLDGVELPLTKALSTAPLVTYRRGYRLVGFSGQQVVAWHGTAPTATQLRTIYQYGKNVLTETTAARFTRLLDTTSIPAAWEGPTTSPAGTVAPLTVGGAPLTSELELVTTSEGGELFVTKAGVLTMTNRTYYATNTKSITTQATFGGSGEIPIAPEASYILSADEIRNSLEISWAGDTTYSVKDTASINEYGAQQTTISTQLSTLADVTNLGSYLVGYGKVPRYIFSDTIVGQALTAAQWNTVLNLELLERIRVTIDLQTGNDPAQTQLIQAIEHDITPGDWRTTIRGSSRWSSVFILDSSLLDGLDLLA